MICLVQIDFIMWKGTLHKITLWRQAEKTLWSKIYAGHVAIAKLLAISDKTLKHFEKFNLAPSVPSSLLQCCCSRVTLQSHLDVAEGKGSASVFQGFLARIVASYAHLWLELRGTPVTPPPPPPPPPHACTYLLLKGLHSDIFNPRENLSIQVLRKKMRTLRWLNTVLRAVSGNSRWRRVFKSDKRTGRRKSNVTQ